MNYLSSIYKTSLALVLDLYELTMAMGFWKSGRQEEEAAFHLSFRKIPFEGGFAVAGGLQTAIEFLEQFRFDDSDLKYLASLKTDSGQPLFETAFIKYLETFRFTCNVDAVPEGTIVFAHEPLLRVVGPLIEAQIVETALLTIINFQTLIATKAARITLVAAPDPVVEFGLRRAQGIDGGLSAARAAYIGGCQATSNVLAAKILGIPTKGTHAHSWVMSYDDETAAFRSYAHALPDNCVFLVDTYNTIEGVKHAIEIAKELSQSGHALLGVRLDSGDLAYLSIEARKLLDAAGLTKVRILATNDLDEHIIASLKQQGAAIDTWGVGTKLVTAFDEPALGGVYKLSAIRTPGGAWQNRLKLSEQVGKISIPGIQQVRRFSLGNELVGDAIYDQNLGMETPVRIIDPADSTRTKELSSECTQTDLLVPIFRKGKLVHPAEPIQTLRDRCAEGLRQLHPGVKRLLHPHTYPVGIEERLHAVRRDLIVKSRREPKAGKALILVDIQNDFLPGGSLAVPEGDAVVPIANQLMSKFSLVLSTQDWHPADHGSFAVSHPGKKPGEQIRLAGIDQTLWPAHCVQGSEGAKFAPGLDRSRVEKIFQKGTNPKIDSYSAFFDNAHLKDTGLGDYLKSRGVTDVYLLGLATDYCVLYSAIDAIGLGFRTFVIEDGCRAVNLSKDDGVKALNRVREAGGAVISSDAVAPLKSEKSCPPSSWGAENLSD